MSANGAPLLIEIGCEEIPARMLRGAAEDLASRLAAILDGGGLGGGARTVWATPRRIATRIDAVRARQPDRDEELLGPPAAVAFDGEGRPTRAAVGFAQKQGIDPARLERIDTPRGVYAGVRRRVAGRTVGEVLSGELPGAVEGMWFPKAMRWGDGSLRWVRPVHWVVALHGAELLELGLLGRRAGRTSHGHRFLHPRAVPIASASEYEAALLAGRVVADPVERRRRLERALERAASEAGGSVVADPALLTEAADLVEWPGVARGQFDTGYLELPRELLVTTLRHHQKCFSVQDGSGRLTATFLAVTDTDADPKGHVRRGNEWVVGGRLEDARFFWREDRKRGLGDRTPELARVVFHARVGSYADKAARMERLAVALANRLGFDEARGATCRSAAGLTKHDLVTGTVGEFPELQGRVGGLLLEAEGAPADVAAAVYHHYRPEGPDDAIPPTDEGCVVAVADKLDSVARLFEAGERPTGSRDPFALRRAMNGVFRIASERRWRVGLRDLAELGGAEGLETLLAGRYENYLQEGGATANEVKAVLGAAGSALERPLHDVEARLRAIRGVREREDFARLVFLTKRVDNILTQGGPTLVADGGDAGASFAEDAPAAIALREALEGGEPRVRGLEADTRYADVVDLLAQLVAPVDRFFEDVLVLDPARPDATRARGALLLRLRSMLTHCFDIRELAGQAERRG